MLTIFALGSNPRWGSSGLFSSPGAGKTPGAGICCLMTARTYCGFGFLQVTWRCMISAAFQQGIDWRTWSCLCARVAGNHAYAQGKGAGASGNAEATKSIEAVRDLRGPRRQPMSRETRHQPASRASMPVRRGYHPFGRLKSANHG